MGLSNDVKTLGIYGEISLCLSLKENLKTS